MPKKNGFIATSIIYSFFVVFVALVVSIMATYAHYRIILNDLNDGILDDLNTTIYNKYALLKNLIPVGNFDVENTNMPGWVLSNAIVANTSDEFHASYSGARALRIGSGGSALLNYSAIEQPETTANANHKIYVRYRYFRSGTLASGTSMSIKANDQTIAIGSDPLAGSYQDWILASYILDVNVSSYSANQWNYNVNITGTQNYSFVYIDDLMVIDVSSLYKNAGSSVEDNSIKTYLDDKLDYFSGAKSILKP